MGLRQVAQTLTAKRITGDKTFYGRVSVLDWNSRPEIVSHIYRFWAIGGTDLKDGEIFYYKDIDKYYFLVSRTPIFIKGRERFISGIAFAANMPCTVQTLVAGSQDSFGYSAKTWTTKLTTYCNFFSGLLDVDQLAALTMPDGIYNITISRTTELLYKVVRGDRIILNGVDYKVDLIDETRYTSNAYICRVVEDDRS